MKGNWKRFLALFLAVAMILVSGVVLTNDGFKADEEEHVYTHTGKDHPEECWEVSYEPDYTDLRCTKGIHTHNDDEECYEMEEIEDYVPVEGTGKYIIDEESGGGYWDGVEYTRKTTRQRKIDDNGNPILRCTREEHDEHKGYVGATGVGSNDNITVDGCYGAIEVRELKCIAEVNYRVAFVDENDNNNAFMPSEDKIGKVNDVINIKDEYPNEITLPDGRKFEFVKVLFPNGTGDTFTLQNKGSAEENGFTLQYKSVGFDGEVKVKFEYGYYESEDNFVIIADEEVRTQIRNEINGELQPRFVEAGYDEELEKTAVTSKVVPGFVYKKLENENDLAVEMYGGKEYIVALTNPSFIGKVYRYVYEKEVKPGKLVVAIRRDQDTYNGPNYKMPNKDKDVMYYDNSNYLHLFWHEEVDFYEYFEAIDAITNTLPLGDDYDTPGEIKKVLKQTLIDENNARMAAKGKQKFSFDEVEEEIVFNTDDYYIEYTNLNWEGKNPSGILHLDGILKKVVKPAANLVIKFVAKDGTVIRESVMINGSADDVITKETVIAEMDGKNVFEDGIVFDEKTYEMIGEWMDVTLVAGTTEVTLLFDIEGEEEEETGVYNFTVRQHVKGRDGKYTAKENVVSGKFADGKFILGDEKRDKVSLDTVTVDGKTVDIANIKFNGMEALKELLEPGMISLDIMADDFTGINKDIEVDVYYDPVYETINTPPVNNTIVITPTPDIPEEEIIDEITEEPIIEEPIIEFVPVPEVPATPETPETPATTPTVPTATPVVPTTVPVVPTPAVQIGIDEDGNIVLTPVEDLDTALADLDLGHICNILYFIMLLCTTVALGFYYRSAKLHNERIFEIRKELGEDDPYKKN